jgi:hypothetical protein
MKDERKARMSESADLLEGGVNNQGISNLRKYSNADSQGK